MKKSMVYTRTGDAGATSLIGGKRVSKTHVRLEAYGTIDELNAHLGLLVSGLMDEDIRAVLLQIQQKLFVVGAMLATHPEAETNRLARALCEEDVAFIEQCIDETDAILPSCRVFTLPGGSPAAAQCHVCRTVCRRAERRIHALAEVEPVEHVVLSYVNRLSDYLYILSRKINLMQGVDENVWQNT